jgi:hypothetical protein
MNGVRHIRVNWPYMPSANFKSSQQQNITIAFAAYVRLMLLVTSITQPTKKQTRINRMILNYYRGFRNL